MYLFVRAVTGDWRAAFVSGLLYAFTPYRLDQAPHLQVMWSGWMPLVLLGIRRYFDATERAGLSPAPRVSASTLGGSSATWRRASAGVSAPAPRRHPAWYLAGAASALVAQNLSCGYFMLFFPPFVVLYALFELVSRRRLGDRRAWVALTATGAVAFAATLPFMAPYFELRESGIRSRGIPEIASFSADTYAYLTAQSNQRLWRWLAAFPRPEGHLFPGLVPIVLAVLGAAAAVVHAVRPAIGRRPMGEHRRTGRERLRHAAAVLTCTAGVVSLGLLAGMFYGFEGRYEIGPLSIRLFSVFRPFLYAVIAAGLTLALSSHGTCRRVAARSAAGDVGRVRRAARGVAVARSTADGARRSAARRHDLSVAVRARAGL